MDWLYDTTEVDGGVCKWLNVRAKKGAIAQPKKWNVAFYFSTNLDGQETTDLKQDPAYGELRVDSWSEYVPDYKTPNLYYVDAFKCWFLATEEFIDAPYRAGWIKMKLTGILSSGETTGNDWYTHKSRIEMANDPSFIHNPTEGQYVIDQASVHGDCKQGTFISYNTAVETQIRLDYKAQICGDTGNPVWAHPGTYGGKQGFFFRITFATEGAAKTRLFRNLVLKISFADLEV